MTLRILNAGDDLTALPRDTAPGALLAALSLNANTRFRRCAHEFLRFFGGSYRGRYKAGTVPHSSVITAQTLRLSSDAYIPHIVDMI